MPAELAVVTGGTGFVATEIVKQLLEKGYRVRATVRDPRDAAKTAALRALGEALPGTLELAAGDLLREGSFDEAVAGADVVFHVASPFLLKVSDPRKELVEPALRGTENVLGSVVRASPRPRRLVLTSSTAAVTGSAGAAGPRNGRLYTPEDWNETSTVENGEAYRLGKTLAERRAWEIARAEGIELVSILPSIVFGPITDPAGSGSSRDMMLALLAGKADNEGTSQRIADVRDVAQAHILAAQLPAAAGRRFIVAAPAASLWSEVRAWLREAFPDEPVAEPHTGEAAQVQTVDVSETIRVLGVSPRHPRETVLDMARTLLAAR